MNFHDFFVKVLHILGIAGGGDTATTAISTVDNHLSSRFTSPIAFDESTLSKLHYSSVSPKFVSAIVSTHNTEDELARSTFTVTGMTQDVKTSESDQSTDAKTTVTEIHSTDSKTTGSGGPPTTAGTTNSPTTVTGQTDAPTTGPATSDHPGTTAKPTEAPGLSRGAVAGIVIGCLLLVTVIAAAVIFFMKNRNIPPEEQRLRV